jgi:uncharacterized protein
MKSLICVFAALASASSAPAFAQDVPFSLRPGEVLLQVEAEGTSRDRPDVMTIGAGVVTNGATAVEAMVGNRLQADRVFKSLQGAGVQASDVQTSDLAVEPVFAESQGGRVNHASIAGYVARNTLGVRLRNLDRAAAIIDALAESGANDVHGPNFSLSNPKPAKRQARINSIAAAREEAETYAEASGMKIARTLRISERGQFSYASTQDIVISGSRIPPTHIEPGELETRIHVWVDYALTPK